MRELPILFSGPMVRALKEGRKTQTRRLSGLKLVNEDPNIWEQTTRHPNGSWAFRYPHEGRLFGEAAQLTYASPRYRIGDRLWVRETFISGLGVGGQDEDGTPINVIYRADDGPNARSAGPWSPAIHMPRWASRLALEVSDVRCERLQEIAEEDAKAEGVQAIPIKTLGWKRREILGEPPETSYRMAFANLWDGINGKKPGSDWKSDPWVFVYELRRTTDGLQVP